MRVGALTKMLIPWVVLFVTMAHVMERSAGQGCSTTFFSSLVQLIPCRPALAPYSPIQPSDACCSAVKALGQPCLCILVNGPPIAGVDRNMAMQLPTKCTTDFGPLVKTLAEEPMTPPEISIPSIALVSSRM
ncbi:hypothetical protein Syun_017395 [Stephania yunnanensis]|uniref:Bifunctional inhibitor/plant lipid transfer protein/seed storage helical domain-containing protein n=1 Tax=Stephania yunnanensis TaxID=152371 RepID=A0AAP0J939_9MAGN